MAGRKAGLAARWKGALLVIALARLGSGAGEDPGPRVDGGPVPGSSAARARVIREEITPELRLSVKRALDWIVLEQTRTLSFSTSKFPVAENALTGLALLAGGYSMTEGPEPYVRALRISTERLLQLQDDAGYFGDDGSRMYGHGFAALFLAELYGTSADDPERIRQALVRAVRLIERAQAPDGSWDYLPVPGGVRPNGGDTSITVCQTMALRAASNLGVTTDLAVRERARRFIERAQRDNGTFRYQISGPDLPTPEFPRTAAGVCILYSLGDHTSSRLRSGILYLEREREYLGLFPHYAHYYCSQAMFQVGGRRWQEYFRWIRDKLLEYQRRDGSWPESRSEPSATVRTALALVVLQLPYRFLPIHER